MDVVRAAEPDAVATARAGLEKASRSAGVPAFSMAEGAGPASSTPAKTASVDDPKKKPFVEFEAMVLQTFLQSMLPSDSESVYGSGLSGDMWKSLLAQEMGKAMAQTGGIGIADKVAADFEPDSQDVFGGADLGRVEGEVAFGNVIFAEKGGIETAINIGQKTFHEFVVELLD